MECGKEDRELEPFRVGVLVVSRCFVKLERGSRKGKVGWPKGRVLGE